VITAAASSAGIDMALRLVMGLAGKDRAREVCRGIQYDWQFETWDELFVGHRVDQRCGFFAAVVGLGHPPLYTLASASAPAADANKARSPSGRAALRARCAHSHIAA